LHTEQHRVPMTFSWLESAQSSQSRFALVVEVAIGTSFSKAHQRKSRPSLELGEGTGVVWGRVAHTLITSATRVNGTYELFCRVPNRLRPRAVRSEVREMRLRTKFCLTFTNLCVSQTQRFVQQGRAANQISGTETRNILGSTSGGRISGKQSGRRRSVSLDISFYRRADGLSRV